MTDKFCKRKKKDEKEHTFVLKNIDIVKIDTNHNMHLINNYEKDMDIFDFDKGTKINELGLSTIKKEPITTIISKEKTKLQTYIHMIDIVNQQNIPTSTNIPCFGCRRKYTTPPIGIPIEYYPSVYIKNDGKKILTINDSKKINSSVEKREYFDTDGMVCSINCISLAIKQDSSPKYKKTLSLIPTLYKCIFEEYPKENIIEAPSWRLRKEYGGPLTDDEYVKNLQVLKFTDTQQIFRPVGRIFRVEEINK